MTDSEKSSATAISDNEIIKVAECCICSQSKADCFRLGCPAATAGGENCRIWELTEDDSDNAVLNQIIKELVTVINRKNADIEELKLTCDKERADRLYLSHQNKAIIAGQETLQKALAEKIKEVERLQLENSCFADIGKMHSEIRVEAIKEFAERFKEKLRHIPRYDYGQHAYYMVGEQFIDNLVKEMVGDTE